MKGMTTVRIKLDNYLKCTICGESVDNLLYKLTDHLLSNHSDADKLIEEAEDMNASCNEVVLSYYEVLE